MNPTARILIFSGIALIIAGLIWNYGGKFLSLGKLPGDIRVEKENFQFYLPLTTSLLVSAVLSLLFWIFRQKS